MRRSSVCLSEPRYLVHLEVICSSIASYQTGRSSKVVCFRDCLSSTLSPFCPSLFLPFGCVQLRIHDSQRVNFYVHVASGPIIEDCTGLRFAPSELGYPQHSDQLKVLVRQLYMPNIQSFTGVLSALWDIAIPLRTLVCCALLCVSCGG